MKKIITIGGLVAVVFGLTGIAYAASGSISLSPAAKNVSPGQVVTATVTVNPGTSPVYTVKTKITYPAALVQVQSFTFSDGWLPLTQSGYDIINNDGGVLIKTAGYPSGLSSSKVLGTITFKVKAAGTATVAVSGDSLLLDAGNENMFSSGSGLTLTSVQPTPTPTPTATLIAAVSTPTEDEEVPVAESPTPTDEPTVDLTAQASADTGDWPAWRTIALAIFGGAVLIAVVIARVRARRKRMLP